MNIDVTCSSADINRRWQLSFVSSALNYDCKDNFIYYVAVFHRFLFRQIADKTEWTRPAMFCPCVNTKATNELLLPKTKKQNRNLMGRSRRSIKISNLLPFTLYATINHRILGKYRNTNESKTCKWNYRPFIDYATMETWISVVRLRAKVGKQFYIFLFIELVSASIGNYHSNWSWRFVDYFYASGLISFVDIFFKFLWIFPSVSEDTRILYIYVFFLNFLCVYTYIYLFIFCFVLYVVNFTFQ